MESAFDVAQLDETLHFAHLDSGAPPESDDYVTLVCVHGHTYHALNFARALARAPAHNVRLIALNRRDYVGSSPFTPDELTAIHSGDPAVVHAFLKERGREVLRFLAWVIAHKAIPRAKEGGGGGVALLGWSLGNVTTVSMLAYLGEYEKELVDKVQPWLTDFIIYEVGAGSLGYPIPEGGYHPLRDPSIPALARMMVFGTWVSSYYAHPYFVASASASGSKKERVVTALQTRTPPDGTEARQCTLMTIPPAELRASLDTAPGMRSEQAFAEMGVDVLGAMRRAALLRVDGGDALPRLRVRLVFGTASVWSTPWAAWSLEAELAQLRQEGAPVRDVAIVSVEGANHFMHVDEPDRFLEIIGGAMRS